MKGEHDSSIRRRTMVPLVVAAKRSGRYSMGACDRWVIFLDPWLKRKIRTGGS